MRRTPMKYIVYILEVNKQLSKLTPNGDAVRLRDAKMKTTAQGFGAAREFDAYMALPWQAFSIYI